MPTITGSNPTSTSIQVTWSGVTNEDKPGATYNFVRVDEYQASIFAAVKPGEPLPKAEQSQGAPGPEAGATLSAADGTVTLFENLSPGTSYVFVLYGYADLGSGGAPQPTGFAYSAPLSTLARSSPPPHNGSPTYPALSTQNFPKTLETENHIVVSCANSGSFDHWNLSVNTVQQSQDLSDGDTFTIWSQPGQKFVINAVGKIHNADYSPWGPNIPIAAGPNSNSIRTFLHNSGVDGSGGLTTFVLNSRSTSLRSLLGL